MLRADVFVSAAASLEAPLLEIAADFEERHPDLNVSLNFGGSNALARQIENGAPVHVFLSADEAPVNRLIELALTNSENGIPLLTNSLVLIGRTDRSLPRTIAELLDPLVRIVAIAEPATAPAGTYAASALQKFHLFEKLRPKLVYAKDVRQVTTWVATGNADAGFVYATDVDDRVRVVSEISASTHPSIRYTVVVLRKSPQSEKFLAQLTSPTAQKIFQSHGFIPLPYPPTKTAD